MAGHSKWANIKRTKEANDKKRANIFTRLAKDIVNATRIGESGDIGANSLLKIAVDKAKSVNMTSDKIEKAINRGLGITDGNDISYENTYEFYGPEGTAFIIDTETDNPNRTIVDLKTLASKIGLKMANAGSISWQFSEVGYLSIEIIKDLELAEDLVLEILDIPGIIDVKREDENSITIYTVRESFDSIVKKLKNEFNEKLALKEFSLIKTTDNKIELNEETQKRAEEIEDQIQEIQEVANIWTNYTK